MMEENRMKAQALLRFYFRRLFKAAGAEWDNDAAADIETIVPALLEAQDEKIEMAIAKAMRSLAVRPPALVKYGNEVMNLDLGWYAAYKPDSGRLLVVNGLQISEIEPPAAAAFWEVLVSGSLDLCPKTLQKKEFENGE